MRRTLVVVLLFLLQGCDLFKTRDPESPSQGSSTRVPPTHYEDVLTNLQFAIREDNVENYTLCFTNPSDLPFQFLAASEARASFPGVFDQWSLESERRYFQNLGTPYNGIPSLTFRHQTTISVGSDSVIYNTDYTLFYPHRRPGIPQIVSGNMQLHLALDSQRRFWSIDRWQDFRTTTDSTWSYLKAVFSGS